MHKKTAKKLLKKVKNDYNKISNEFHATRKHSWKEFEIFLSYIKNDNYLADLGCGNGRFLSFLESNNLHTKYIGIDNSKNLLKAAQKSHNKKEFIYGDLLELPLTNNQADIATSIASLHHIPSKEFRQKSIQEVHRILKPNGILLLTVWNLFQPKYKKYIWQSRIKSVLSLGKYDPRDTFIPWSKSGIKRYYYAFTLPELENLIKNNGFKILEAKVGNNFTLVCQKQQNS